MAKLTSGRVKRTPPSGITSDRYQFLGLEQAEPSLGDPLVGPSSIGANPIKVGAFYQLASIAEYPGERYWSTQVGIGTTLGIISVYANGELPNSAFGRIHGLNFVGTGVTIETPSLDFIGDVGIATIRFTVTDILNQGQPGQVLYNGPNGLAIGSTDLNYYAGNVGIGTSLPNSKLEVIGDVTASNFYGNLLGDATNATNVIGGIASVTSLNVSGISTLGNIQISSGIITATIGTATYYGNLIGNADYASIAGFAYTSYADTAGFSTTSGIATSVIGGIASVTSLRVSGNSTLGITSAQNLNVSGVSTLGFVTASDAFFIGSVTATTFYGNVDGFVDNAGYAKTAGISTDVIGGIASVTNLNVTGFSTLANVYVNNTITGPSIIYIDPTVVGDDTGTVVVKGNLEVKGTTTTIESQTLTVVDKNIELATGSTLDSVSDGGGITLKGTTDHTISFNDTDDAWEFSENLTPNSDDSKDLGTPFKKWKTLYVNNVYSGFTSTTDLNVSGVSTLGITSATQLTVSGVSTLGFITATDAFFTGVVTATRFYGTIDGVVDNAAYAAKAGVSTDVIGGIASVTQLYVSGISTLGGIQISAGIVSATTGIATYYGRFIGTADFATTAGFAYTVYADTSGFSTTSGISTNLNGGASGSIPYQYSSGITSFLAGSSTNGWVLTYDTGSNAPVWTNPSTGVNAGTADYATNSGFSTNAGIATYATYAGFSTNSGIATNLKGGSTGSIPYQFSAGVTTFLADPNVDGRILTWDNTANAPVWTNPSTGVNVGTADYATNSGFSTNAGIATYATYAGFSTNSGIATNLKGGSASQIPYQTGDSTTLFIPNGNPGQVLKSNGASVPTWDNITNLGAASTITILGDTSDQNQYLTFVTGVGDTTLGIATTSTSLTFNPSSGNLGIGTTNPNFRLQVDGDIYLNSAFVSSGAGVESSGTIIFSAVSSTSNIDHIWNSDANVVDGVVGTQYGNLPGIYHFVNEGTYKSTGNSALRAGGFFNMDHTGTLNQKLQIEGGAYVSDNVGIGTTNPTEKLDVNGTTRLRGLLKDVNNSQGTPGQLLQSTSSGVSWVSANAIGAATTINIIGDTTNQNQYLTFVTDVGDTTLGIATTSTALTFNASTGSLGIATTPNPNVYLSVGSSTLSKVNHTAQFGNLGIGNAGPQNAFISLNGYWNPNTEEWTYNRTGHSSALQFAYGKNIFRYFGNRTVGTASTTDGYSILSTDQNRQVAINKQFSNVTNLNLLVDIRQSLYTDREYLDSGLTNPTLLGITTVGNVGIGTTNPKAALDVGIGSVYVSNGDIHINGTSFVFNTRNGLGGFWSNGGTDGYASLNNVTPGGSTGFAVKLPSGSAGSFGAPNTANMYQTVSTRHDGTEGITDFRGRVGIGTTNPTSKLHVVGDVRVSGTTSNLFTVTDNTTTGSIFSVNDISGTPYVDVNATTGAITLGPIDGRNVGIGTTNPTQKLQVQGSAYITGALLDSTGQAGSSGQILQSTNTGTQWTSSAAVGFTVSTNPSGNYTLQTSDNGKLISNAGTGWTVPTGLPVGFNVTLFNNTGGNQTFSVTNPGIVYIAGSSVQVSGASILDQRGLATLVCVATNVFVISGAGLR